MQGLSVLVTGCNRGLGLHMVKQLVHRSASPHLVIAACRNPAAATELNKIAAEHEKVHVLPLDVGDKKSYDPFVERVSEVLDNRGLNVLINNAGVSPKSTRINMVKWSQMTDTFLINTVAPLMLTKAVLPHLKTAASQTEGSDLSVRRAAVVNISSILGSIELNERGGLYPYRCSKAALNAVTKSLSIDLRSLNILVTCLHPGWVQTDMGGKNAALTPQQSVAAMLSLLDTLTEDHHGHLYQYDGQKLPW